MVFLEVVVGGGLVVGLFRVLNRVFWFGFFVFVGVS